MINSLPPSIFPTTSPANTANEQALPERMGEKSSSLSIVSSSTSKSQAIDSHESRHARRGDHDDHDHGKSGRSDRSDLFRSAKHMIKDAFKEFRHDLRESFNDLGFGGKLANKIAKNVMHATRDALRSGVDFGAKLMVATISQTTTTGASGTSSSFSMVARSIEVNINHSTGSIDVNTTNVSIEAQFDQGLSNTQPHLLDMHDSDQGGVSDLTGAMLAKQDLDEILEDDEDSDKEAPVILEPAIVTTARESVGSQLGQSVEVPTTETTVTRTAVEAVIEKATSDRAVPVEKSDKTDVIEEAGDDASEEVAATELDVPEIVTPLLLNRPEYSARIFITAYEHTINDREERMTFMRFDAIVPLSAKPVEIANDKPAPILTMEIDPLEDETSTIVA